MIILYLILGLLAGFVLGAGLAYLALRKAAILLWPSGWLPAIRSRRYRRRMSDRAGKTRP